ncbi:MAG: hypothetical protein APG08_01584 [Candidatus Methanofastidiosum methylothiophilum]|uniref:Uncharacterized protein n=1 Tax=Candidatus Methanofastidiosum methylothiophilum TaxID=1705564 RepID=A0A150JEI4_9EURY|nr:MAG: hypothetical protein APG08_01584 [Candidatus Methanofastidiosum methylthiophilus]KYC55720.1 MAG: hypothetical protein APG09_01567 [Candidatus Methanofastidiosum methylthiophilus]
MDNGFRFFSGKNEIVVSYNLGTDTEYININNKMEETLKAIEKFQAKGHEESFKQWFTNAKEKFEEK